MKESFEHASLIYGLLGGLIGSLYLGWVCSPDPSERVCSKPQQAGLAVVDMQILISKKSEQLAKTFEEKIPLRHVTTLPVASQRIREVGERLREDLKTFAATHNLILLAKGAVVGGDLPDKTEEILSWLETEARVFDTSVFDTRFLGERS